MERIKNFDEVALGFTEELAAGGGRPLPRVQEAQVRRRLSGGHRHPGFHRQDPAGGLRGSAGHHQGGQHPARHLRSRLPAGGPVRDGLRHRQEGRAGGHRPARALRRRLGDGPAARSRCPSRRRATGFKVAVVGSGPAGLACAADLALRGHEVTVFEALHKPGGVLVYGIPEFRLPKKIVQDEIDNLEKLGVEIRCNFVVGKTASVEELFTEYGFDAVFIGTGAGLPYFMGIPGENLIGVLLGQRVPDPRQPDEGLRLPRLRHAGRASATTWRWSAPATWPWTVCRTALRLGAENVICLYRRTRDEAPARLEELEHAEEEGIDFRWLASPVEISATTTVWSPASGCRRWSSASPTTPVAAGRSRSRATSTTSSSTSSSWASARARTRSSTKSTKGLELNRWGNIVVDEETMMTSIHGVFAGGDIVTGAATVILAMGAGKKASAGIDAYLKSKATAKTA